MDYTRLERDIENIRSIEDIKSVLYGIVDALNKREKDLNFTLSNLTSDNVKRLDGRTIFEKPELASKDWVVENFEPKG